MNILLLSHKKRIDDILSNSIGLTKMCPRCKTQSLRARYMLPGSEEVLVFCMNFMYDAGGCFVEMLPIAEFNTKYGIVK